MSMGGDQSNSRQSHSPQQPQDAATLILLRNDDPLPRVLMGRRHDRHRFMPGKFVFPGGRMDRDDKLVQPAADLDTITMAKLMLRMRGKPSIRRARGLAMAAVRETFEETGLVIGKRSDVGGVSETNGWRTFTKLGYLPDLSGLRFFARAITPPGRSRRFDTRFFVADAHCVANLDQPFVRSSDELQDQRWVSLQDAKALDVPSITFDILHKLEMSLSGDGQLAGVFSISFGYARGKSWQQDQI